MEHFHAAQCTSVKGELNCIQSVGAQRGLETSIGWRLTRIVNLGIGWRPTRIVKREPCSIIRIQFTNRQRLNLHHAILTETIDKT